MNHLRLPNFIIGGVQRSATTWLATMLDRHPGIYLAKPYNPEVKFFNRDENYARGLAWYSRACFDGAPAGAVLGEKTSGCIERPEAARRIHDAAPGVRMIFILRDPVERAYSNYLYSRRHGLEPESFGAALELEEERNRNIDPQWREIRPWSYFRRGLYAEQLKPFFDLFGPGRIHCLVTEEAEMNPQKTLGEIFSFLGLDRTEVNLDAPEKINASPDKAGSPLPPEIGEQLKRKYSAPNARLRELLQRDLPWPGNIHI